MIGLIVCSAILSAHPSTNPIPPETYAEARIRAGKSPEGQLKLALWCEAHGLIAERERHLSLAALADPRNPVVRGLMGFVEYEGRWLRPEAVAGRVQADPLVVEYEARRASSPETADGHQALGVWADEHNLKDQGRSHLIAATRLDPSRAEAWKRLGYARHGHRWLTDPQVLAEKAEAEAQKQADAKWRPILEKYRQMLGSTSTSTSTSTARRDEAEAGLLEVTDPRAVPSIGRVFANSPSHQARAVHLLGQIQAPASSRSLAYLAVFGQSPKARRLATETLRHRDPREFADLLIPLLRDPIRFEVKHVDGPDSPGELLVEGKKVNLRRVYSPPSAFQAGDRLDFDRFGQPIVVRQVEPSQGALFVGTSDPRRASRVAEMTRAEVEQAALIIERSLFFCNAMPVTNFTFQFGDRASIPMGQMMVEARKSAVATEQQLRDDVRNLEDGNVAIRIGNDRVADVLKDATGQALPSDRSSWSRWWVDRIGYASSSSDWTARPSRLEDVSIAYQPPTRPDNAEREIDDFKRQSCFGAGTSVRTIAGPRPIESLRVGDRVLTQSTATGALGYRPVVGVYHNPPSPTFSIKVNGETIVSSPFHRFWKAGQGWVMAREIRAGDRLRMLDGVSEVSAVEDGKVQLVYNLDIAEDADFFAGQAGALVHDNTLPDPRLVPFDAP